MAYIQSISCIATAAIVLLALSASAQDATTTIKPVTPEVKLSCANAESIGFNASELFGDWFEVARSPQPAEVVACVKVTIDPIANTTDSVVSVTFADDSKSLWMNKTATANVSLANASQPTKAGYSLNFSMNNASWPTRTYKVVHINNDFVLACGYTDATKNATEFSVILTRERMLNSTVLHQYADMAAANFNGFSNGSIAMITQSKECMGKNAAVSTLPFLSAIMAAIYALSMLLN